MDKLVEKYFEIGKLAHRYYLDHKSLGKEFDKISESIIEIEKNSPEYKEAIKREDCSCPNCGYSFDSDSNFCSNCGLNLDKFLKNKLYAKNVEIEWKLTISSALFVDIRGKFYEL